MTERVDQKIATLYPDYMQVIRYVLSEAIEEPTTEQNEWAQKVAFGDEKLARSISLLARASETAFKQRYLEAQPMIIDFDSPSGGEHSGFGSIERFWFLRTFVKEYREKENAGLTDGINGIPPVLYVDPAEYNSE